MHVILTGSTGTVGAPILRQCLATPSITKVSILSRRDFPLPEAPQSGASTSWDSKKAQIIVHKDFESYEPGVLEKLKGAEAVIWAQGRSQNGVSKEEYIRVTNAYPIAAARAFPALSSTGKFNFVFISGEGADQDEKASTLYGNIKGRTEKQLLGLRNDRRPDSEPPLNVYNIRAGWVDPEGKPVPTRPLTKRIVEDTLVGPILRVVMPNIVSPSSVLSKLVVDLATGDGKPVKDGKGVENEGRTIRSDAIRRLGMDGLN